MDNRKNSDYYIEKIVKDLKFIIKNTQGITKEELAENEILLDSMMFRLVQISENARKVDDEYKQQHPEVPWTAVNGLRNRIVHDYGNVDLAIVYTTLMKDIPDLLTVFKK